MKITIRYSRKAKEYRLIDKETGEVVENYPQGSEGKATAERRKLELEHPELAPVLADLVARHGGNDQGRAFRGAQIVADEGVSPNGDVGLFYVDSQDPGKEGIRYLVNLARQRCECEDWQNGWAGHKHGAPNIDGLPFCKHIAACRIFEGMEGKPPTVVEGRPVNEVEDRKKALVDEDDDLSRAQDRPEDRPADGNDCSTEEAESQEERLRTAMARYSTRREEPPPEVPQVQEQEPPINVKVTVEVVEEEGEGDVVPPNLEVQERIADLAAWTNRPTLPEAEPTEDDLAWFDSQVPGLYRWMGTAWA